MVQTFGLSARRRVVALVVMVVVACGVAFSMPSVAFAEVVASGTAGALPWRLETGARTIQGVESTLTLVLGADGQSYQMPSGLRGTNGPWSSYVSQITGVCFEGTVHAPVSLAQAFASMSALKVVEMDEHFDTSAVTDMSAMFGSCSKLEVAGVDPGADLTSLDFSSLTTTENMFNGCTSLTEATLDGIEAPCLTSMNRMFYGCTSLDAVYASEMDLPVLEMTSGMFSGCSGLSYVLMSRVSAPQWALAGSMFEDAGKNVPVADAPYADFSWSSLPSSMNNMFTLCGFTDVTMMRADGSNVTSAFGCFSNAKRLLNVSLDGCLMPNCTTVWSMFGDCEKLERIDFRAADLSGVTTGSSIAPMSSYTGEGLVADFTATKLPQNMSSFFSNCKGLVSCDLRGDLSEVTRTVGAFAGCPMLEEVWVGTGASAPKLTTVCGMFSGCTSLERVRMDGVVSAALKDASSFASNCPKLSELYVRNWDLSGATSVGGFVAQSGAQASSENTTYGGLEVYLGGAKMPVGVPAMFAATYAQRVDFEDVDFSGTQNMSSFFGGASGIKEIDLTTIRDGDLSGVVDMGSFAVQCPALTRVNLSGLDASSVTTMSGAFATDSSLTQVDMGGMTLSSDVVSVSMFDGCVKMSHVVMPENLLFATTKLPDVPTDDVNDGTWLYLEDASTHTSAELMAETPGAGTYVWDGTDVFRIRYLPGEGRGDMFEQAWLTVDGAWRVADASDRFSLFDHEFAGWNVNEDGSGDAYEPGMFVESVPQTSSYVLYAQWVPGSHEVTLANGAFDVKVPAGYRLVVDDLPASVDYAVWEESEDGWTLVSSTDTTGSVEPTRTKVARFTNRYAPGTAAMQVVGTKTLDGKLVGGGSFAFELVEDDTVIQTAHNGDGGIVAFEPIVYDAAGRHSYVVREKAGLVTTFTYDKTEYRVVVDVTDDGAGHLSTKAYYPDGMPSWANKTNLGSVKLTKQVTGGSAANADDEFSFTVRLTDPDGNLVDGATVVKSE